VTPELTIVTGTATYKEPPTVYSNLWVMRLDADGRCREFTEWWMQHPAKAGQLGLIEGSGRQPTGPLAPRSVALRHEFRCSTV
jgi:hypothetical protein